MTLRCTFLLSGESDRHPHLGNPTLGKPSFASVLYFEGGTEHPTNETCKSRISVSAEFTTRRAQASTKKTVFVSPCHSDTAKHFLPVS